MRTSLLSTLMGRTGTTLESAQTVQVSMFMSSFDSTGEALRGALALHGSQGFQMTGR